MAAPTVDATNTSIHDSDVTSHTVSLPAGISSGDLLIVIFAVDANPGVTWPGGWTEIAEVLQEAQVTLAVAYRQADGGEGATIIVTSGTAQMSAHTTYKISGHENPATQAPELSTGANGFGVNPDPDSLSPTGGSKDYLWLAVHAHDGTRSTDAFPTNYTNGISTQGVNGGSAGAGSAERQLTAAAEDPGAFTISASEQWAAATVAVHPVGAGGVTVLAALATATALGYAAVITTGLVVAAALATATALSLTAKHINTIKAAVATAVTQSYAATISGAARILAVLTTASAQSYAATIIAGDTVIGAALATASALSYAATHLNTIPAAMSTATAASYAATVSGATVVLGALATATAQSYAATVSGVALVAAALSTAAAKSWEAVVNPGAVVAGVVATATAQALEAVVTTPISVIMRAGNAFGAVPGVLMGIARAARVPQRGSARQSPPQDEGSGRQ